jgi:hypothetical protein
MTTKQEKLLYAFGTLQGTMMARYGIPKYVFQTLVDNPDTSLQHTWTLKLV